MADMQYGLAIITSLLTAKIVGDLLNHSFYELLLHFKMFPYLAWEPPHDFQQVFFIIINSLDGGAYVATSTALST